MAQGLLSKLTVRRASLAIGAVSALAMYVLQSHGLSPSKLIDDYSEVMLGFSFAVLLLPTATIPLVVDIASKAGRLGIRFNPRLFNDYVEGSFTSALSALITIISIASYNLTKNLVTIYISILFFASTLTALTMILLGLKNLAKNVYQALLEESQATRP